MMNNATVILSTNEESHKLKIQSFPINHLSLSQSSLVYHPFCLTRTALDAARLY